MAKAKQTTSAAKVRTLDFTGVKDRGQFNPRHREPGEYLGRCVAVEEGESKNGNEQLIFTIQLEGDKRASYPLYCPLEAKSLWKIRQLITSVGLPTPTGRAKVNPQAMLNKVFGLLLEDDEYEGRVKSKVQDFWPKAEGGPYENAGETSKSKGRVVEDDDEDDDEDEDDEPVKPAKKASKKKAPVVEEDDDDDDEDDEEDEEPAPKKSTKKAPAKAAKKRAPEPEEDDDEEDEDEDDEDDAPPPKKKSKKTSKVSPAKKKRGQVDEDDDDDELDTDDL